MKKILIIIGIIMVIFIAFVYLSVSETKDNFRTCTILDIEEIDKTNFKDFDSITVAANTLYDASIFKQVMQGEQYREAWSTPVTVPIAFLDTLKGGLRIIEEGGGMQTHSLELEDSLGIRYSLRSVSKDPEPLVPEIAKDLGIENIVIDGISAQHPYAALVVANLAGACDLIHTNPKLMFVPKQNSLGQYNEKFGNRLFYFEFESEGKVNWTGLPHVSEIIDTEDLQELKSEKGKVVEIDKQALIRARLFDLLIGDWDRHAKQWGWAIQKKDDAFVAVPIAADRDNAFFNQDGILPSLIANELTIPEMQDFESDIESLEGLVSTFDEYFLRTADLKAFNFEAIELMSLLSDSEIDKAFEVWPQTIYNLNGSEIRDKIISRRGSLVKYAEEFYKIIQKRPLKKIKLKGSEELILIDELTQCFDCIKSIPKKL